MAKGVVVQASLLTKKFTIPSLSLVWSLYTTESQEAQESAAPLHLKMTLTRTRCARLEINEYRRQAGRYHPKLAR